MTSQSLQKSRSSSRRDFFASSAAWASLSVVPSWVLGDASTPPPSNRLNLAGIGAGGNMCRNDLERLVSEGQQIVAVADALDFEGWLPAAQEAFRKFYPNAKIYRDYREMLDKEPGIDGVVVATPDHWHAKITSDAMAHGKHVYTQKPLTRTISEARHLDKLAAESKLATQMGNNGHAGEWIRLVCEYIWDGTIGPVREVHAWSDRAGYFWRTGVPRPAETPPVPTNLDWDLWLGPAPSRPYHPSYMPIAWRGWCDFGTGALGDMGCHILDAPYWALYLRHPTTVEATATLENPETRGETFPSASIITYRFPARQQMPPLKLTWYDGGLQPPLPDGFPRRKKLATNGTIFIGEKGVLYNETFQAPQVFLHGKSEQRSVPKKTLPRSPGHYAEWVAACRGKSVDCGAKFSYGAKLTELVLLGAIACRVNEPLEWDGAAMRFTNHAGATELVQHNYRKGWSLC